MGKVQGKWNFTFLVLLSFHSRPEFEFKPVVLWRAAFPGMWGMFIPREKESGDDPGGTNWDFWELDWKRVRKKKFICEAEVPPCDWTLQSRRGWGHNIQIIIIPPSQNLWGKKNIWRKWVENPRIFTSGWHKLANQILKKFINVSGPQDSCG